MLEPLKFLQEHQQLLEDEDTIKLNDLVSKLEKEHNIKEWYNKSKEEEENSFYQQFKIIDDTSTNNESA